MLFLDQDRRVPLRRLGQKAVEDDGQIEPGNIGRFRQKGGVRFLADQLIDQPLFYLLIIREEGKIDGLLRDGRLPHQDHLSGKLLRILAAQIFSIERLQIDRRGDVLLLFLKAQSVPLCIVVL